MTGRNTSRANDQRQAIVDACRRMNSLGINQGTSGNISVRCGDGLLITPTSVPYDAMSLEQIVFMDMNGAFAEGSRPSSEWRFHLDILRARPDVGAVLHAHPTYCTILAIMGLEIPAIHYMVAAAGGPNIRCAPYATYGTTELSAHAVRALEGRSACLLAHHGMIAVGPSLEKALWLAIEVEALARQYHGCLQLGKPPLLPVDEIERVRVKMVGYGHADA
jgi:L-fuculose-phosphate aldolase